MKQVQAAEVSQRRTAVSSKCFKLYYTCSDCWQSRSPRALSIFFPPLTVTFPKLCYFASTIDTREAVPWLRRLVAGLSQRSPVFAPGSINMGLVVDKVALGHVFLRVLRFSPVNIIPPSFSILITSRGWTICPSVAAVQRRSLTTSKSTIYRP
jgi:hypothetical protein